MNIGQKILVILAAVIITLCLASCSRNEDSAASDGRPFITVGSSDYPPFIDMDNSGDPTGLDMDILREAFDRIGYDIRFVEISWEDKDYLLSSGTVDCVAGGFTMESREEDYLWVGPYVSSNQVVVVNATGNIDSLGALKGRTIAVQSASIAEDILLRHENPAVPEDVQLLSYEDNSLLFAALGCNYVDAIVADEPAVSQYMKDYDTSFIILDEPVMYAGVGAAFDINGDAELCRKLNSAVREMREDGTLTEIVRRYLDAAERYMEAESEN